MRVLVCGTNRVCHHRLVDQGHELVLFMPRGKVRPEDAIGPYRQVVVLDDDAGLALWVDTAQACHRAAPFDAVVAYNEGTYPAVAAISAHLGVPTTVDVDLFERVRDKARMRRLLAEHAIASCRYAYAQGTEAVLAAVAEIGLPCIVKPVDGEASLGVARIGTWDDVDAALARVGEHRLRRGVVVEEFLTGAEFSVEAVSIAGRHHIVAVTEKFKDNDTFVELGHLVPARIEPADRDAIEQYVTRVLDAFGFHDCPSHTELMLTAQGPRIIETHNRIGGDRIMDLICHASGVDMYDVVARQSLGADVTALLAAARPVQSAAVWYADPTAPPTHVLAEVHGLDEVRGLPFVRTAEVLREIGSSAVAVRQSTDRSGLVVAVGPGPAEALRRARSAAGMLRFVYTGPPAIDVVNAIARSRCADTQHRLYFRQGAGIGSLSWAQVDAGSVRVARRLHELGIGPRDRIGIMAPNRIEWVLLDLAVLKLGAVTAGFEHGRFEPAQAVADYGLALMFAQGAHGDGPVRDIDVVASWAGDESADGDLPEFDGYDPADVCAIKFTSGSTGVPKGLEASVASINGSLAAVQEMFAHGEGDNILVFLRLALLQQRYWIYSGLVHGHDVTLADLADALPMARATGPTVVMGVPGFYEDLKARIEASADLSAQPCGVAVQRLLGGRVRYLWTGSAPASRAVLDFFNGGGVPLYEGYGLNETCIVAKNHPGAFRPGSVGKVLPGKRIRFDREGILIVGSDAPVNCRYTWCGPGVNERTFLPTGEVKTYDLGYVDDDGFLYIRGRVDDVLTLSNGRNVLVRPIEERLREHPAVHECVLYGNGRGFLTAVVSPAGPDLDSGELSRHVAAVNREWHSEQRIHAVVVVPDRFSVDNGLLSSQYKPKRQDIHRRYAAAIEALYSVADSAHQPAPSATEVRVVVLGAAGRTDVVIHVATQEVDRAQ